MGGHPRYITGFLPSLFCKICTLHSGVGCLLSRSLSPNGNENSFILTSCPRSPTSAVLKWSLRKLLPGFPPYSLPSQVHYAEWSHRFFPWSTVAASLLPLPETGISTWKLVSFLVGLALSNEPTCLHEPFPRPWLLWKTELLQINQPHEHCSSCPGCCRTECCVFHMSGSPREGGGRSYGMVCSEQPSCHTLSRISAWGLKWHCYGVHL